MTDRLKRSQEERVGELQTGEDPTDFAARLQAGPVSLFEANTHKRRLPSGSESYQALLAAAYPANNLPAWTHKAACAGEPTDDWYTDEVADLGAETVFPETVYAALRVCATCPVQRECLDWAYSKEDPVRSRWVESTDVDDDRYGVFACPGKIRERFASYPDRIERCLAWLASVASDPERRWVRDSEEGEEVI